MFNLQLFLKIKKHLKNSKNIKPSSLNSSNTSQFKLKTTKKTISTKKFKKITTKTITNKKVSPNQDDTDTKSISKVDDKIKTADKMESSIIDIAKIQDTKRGAQDFVEETDKEKSEVIGGEVIKTPETNNSESYENIEELDVESSENNDTSQVSILDKSRILDESRSAVRNEITIIASKIATSASTASSTPESSSVENVKILDTNLLRETIDSTTQEIVNPEILDFEKIKVQITEGDTTKTTTNSVKISSKPTIQTSDLEIKEILDIKELLGVDITESPHEIPNSTTINLFTPNSTTVKIITSTPSLNSSTTSNDITKSSNSPIITILAASCSVFTALVLLCLFVIT